MTPRVPEYGGIEDALAEEVAWRGLNCRGCGHALNEDGFCPQCEPDLDDNDLLDC